MEKIKSFLAGEAGKDSLVIFIVILVGFGSFELGRLSKTSSSDGIKVEYASGMAQNVVSAAEPVKTQVSGNTGAKAFFASNRGSKYYPAGCTAGQNLKPENRIYFSTSAEAEKAGYELSSSCKE